MTETKSPSAANLNASSLAVTVSCIGSDNSTFQCFSYHHHVIDFDGWKNITTLNVLARLTVRSVNLQDINC